MFKVASIQMRHSDTESKADRITRAEQLIDKAADADVIVLPETWNVGWWSFNEWQDSSEPLNGETISRMAEKAKQVNAYILAGSIIERAEDGSLYNTAVFLDPKGKIIATYRKMHLVGFRVHGGLDAEEKFIVKRGQEPVSVKTDLGVFGFSICYDIRFPELYRKMAIEQGVEVFLFIAGWPMAKLDNWQALTQVRANENLCWLVSCCPTGLNRGLPYLGYSAIINPNGLITAQARTVETIVKGEIDINEIYEVRKALTALDDRIL